MSDAAPNLIDRVAVQASTAKPLRLLRWLIVTPFYVLGWIVALMWVLGAHAVFAVRVGVVEGRARMGPKAPAAKKSEGT